MQRARVAAGRILAALLCVVILAGPVAAQGSVSEQQELALGRLAAGELIGEFGLVYDTEWIAFLSVIRDRLLPFSGRPGIPYRIVILQTPVPTALSTPGWLFVTTGLIRLGLDADGWTFVIGHEMGHTAKRHVAALVERANAAALMGALIGILTGSRVAYDAVRLVSNLALLGFGRELEAEADAESLRMMVEAGYDSSKAASTLAWFNEATGRKDEQTHWSGTHPGWAERIARVNAAYAGFPARGLPLRVRYLRERKEADGVMVTATRLAEMVDAWVLSVTVDNTGDQPVTIFVVSAVLSSPEGDLPLRFTRSSLRDEVGAKGQVSGDLVFEKRSSQVPTTLTLPIVLPDARRDLQMNLTGGGPYAPEPSPSPLPRPPVTVE